MNKPLVEIDFDDQNMEMREVVIFAGDRDLVNFGRQARPLAQAQIRALSVVTSSPVCSAYALRIVSQLMGALAPCVLLQAFPR